MRCRAVFGATIPMLLGAAVLLPGLAVADVGDVDGGDSNTGSSDTGATVLRVASQELGAQVGIATGGRTTPGGLDVAGHYSYRLNDSDWVVTTAEFVFGGAGSACVMDDSQNLSCDHGATSGFSGGVSVAIRHYFAPSGDFAPYALVGLGGRVASFRGDEIVGFAVPLIAGGGVRAKAHDSVGVFGAAQLQAGPAWFNRDLGSEPHLAFHIAVGVEFAID